VNKTERVNDFNTGVRNGLPIGLGYFAVSFAFGIFAAEGGIAPLTSAVLSFTNLTSAGQFAGVRLIFTGAPWFEIAMTVLLINLRYSLMSLSLSQRLAPDMSFISRILIGYGITMRERELSLLYMLGLSSLPIVGWTAGTWSGAMAGYILPVSWRSALSIALYAMFVAIIMPQARRSRAVLFVVAFAALLSIMFEYLPLLSMVPLGWRIIICTVLASCAGAVLAPIRTSSANPGGEIT
jgi:predicted branched-subunit amino acid permease